MTNPTAISQLDFTPLPGKTYTNFDREWREEFIYFLMVDRFQDDSARSPSLQAARSLGVATPNDFYGGTIRGITRNLDYIAGLGCTAIWISPVFENNPHSYHGYDINNYLGIDPHFGTKADLIDLVNKAHGFQKNGKPYPIRIVLDVVTNHSGDNWGYVGDSHPSYSDAQLDFGFWRKTDRPIPVDLRKEELYHRRGQIQNYDQMPQMQFGDLFSLKDFENDDDANGSILINILIAAHCYWIREADIDGFRVDAVKHMGPVACSRFCSNIREYAYSLGKRDFFLFGELASPSDELVDRYIGANTSVQSGSGTVFFGIDSLLDFRLAEGEGGGGLRDVIKGFADPATLFERLASQNQRALNHGEIGRYLVTFADNHDSFWQPAGRIGAGAPDEQVIAAMGFLLCSLGTACIYYGTEQGFQGQGGDNQMREAMFDLTLPGKNLMNSACHIYQEISKIAAVMRSSDALRFGRMYYRQISGDGQNFGLPFGQDYTLAFSRLLARTEVLVAYNVSAAARTDRVVVDGGVHPAGSSLKFLYGGAGSAVVNGAANGTCFVRLNLAPRQFVILG